MAHVFISYARADLEFARDVSLRLEHAGFEVWLDIDRLRAGEDWRQAIDKALRNAFALIVIVTPQANSSQTVAYEWTFALGLGIKVIPIVYKDLPTRDVNPHLVYLEYLLFTDSAARPWHLLIELLRNALQHYETTNSQLEKQLSSTVENVVSTIERMNNDTRQEALYAVTQAGDLSAVDVLAQALQHSTVEVRVSAQETLAKLLGHSEPDVRYKAALALSKIGDERVVPVLLDALQGTDKDMQLSAVKALVQSDPIGVLELLLEALRDRERAIAWTTERIAKGIPKHIFLSYSRQDIEIMYRIRDVFQVKNLVVWTDENLEKGTPSWKRAIEGAIESAGCLVVILSPDAKKSEWVRAELDHAQMHKIRIFPILALGDESSSVPFGFGSNQWTDIRQEENYKSEIEKLINAIYNHLGR